MRTRRRVRPTGLAYAGNITCIVASVFLLMTRDLNGTHDAPSATILQRRSLSESNQHLHNLLLLARHNKRPLFLLLPVFLLADVDYPMIFIRLLKIASTHAIMTTDEGPRRPSMSKCLKPKKKIKQPGSSSTSISKEIASHRSCNHGKVSLQTIHVISLCKLPLFFLHVFHLNVSSAKTFGNI